MKIREKEIRNNEPKIHVFEWRGGGVVGNYIFVESIFVIEYAK
jgi:hypothetical protein